MSSITFSTSSALATTTTTTPQKPSSWKRKSCKFYLKILCGVFFLLVYFAIFLQESIHATKLKQSALKQQQRRVRASSSASSSTTSLVGRVHPSLSNNDVVPPPARLQPGAPVDRTGKRGNNNKTVAENHQQMANSLYEYSDELNAALEQEFAARNQLLAEECANLKLTNALPPNPREFFISPGHSLVWCPVFKAASSLWLYFFNVLGGYNVNYLQRTRSPPLELARSKFPRPSTEEELADALATSTSFFIAREPFERLVSAYRNKFEGAKNKYYKQMGDRIVKKFRARTGKKNPKGPTFEEFARYVVDGVKSGAGLAKINEHWAPIYSFCTPCTINYTLILKTDTLARDSEYIFRQSLVDFLLDKFPRQSKLRQIANRAKTDTKSIKFKYFSTLPVSLLDELLKIYRPDFQLFGYNSTAYYEVLTNHTTTLRQEDAAADVGSYRKRNVA